MTCRQQSLRLTLDRCEPLPAVLLGIAVLPPSSRTCDPDGGNGTGVAIGPYENLETPCPSRYQLTTASTDGQLNMVKVLGSHLADPPFPALTKLHRSPVWTILLGIAESAGHGTDDPAP